MTKSLYTPPQFQSADRGIALTLMREHPFAQLISVDQGAPFITPLPLHVIADGDELVLLGHCAKANPHWRLLQSQAKAWAVFIGPQAYMSPSVYPDLVRVPTWSYLAVHCAVHASLIDEPEQKDALLKKIISDHEPAYAAQWRSLDAEFQQKMLSGIVGFSLRVTELTCKLKLNQHRPEAHAAMHRLYARGSEQERALANWMRRLGMVTVESGDAALE